MINFDIPITQRFKLSARALLDEQYLKTQRVIESIFSGSCSTTCGWGYDVNILALSYALGEDQGTLGEEISRTGFIQVLEKRGLLVGVAGNLRILRALEGTGTRLTYEEINNLVKFIEGHKNTPGYYQADGPGKVGPRYNICRTVEITKDGQIYIHLNRVSRGDTLIGEGGFKRAKFSIDYNAGKRVCRTTEIYTKSPQENLGIIQRFKGKENIIQIIHDSDFFSKRRSKRNQQLKKKEIIQEYYSEGSLDRKLESGMHIQDSVRIGLLVTRALREIHEEGVLHLDLKPGNILLRSDENGNLIPVVIDFGTSKEETQEGRGRDLEGTFVYMPPWYASKYSLLCRRYEKATGEEKRILGEQLDSLVTKDLDIYALSMILVEDSYLKTEHLKSLIPEEYITRGSPQFDPELAKMILRMQMSPENLQHFGEQRITLEEVERILGNFYAKITQGKHGTTS